MTDIKPDKNRLQLHRSLSERQVDQLVALFQEEWWTKG
ncbi:N-acetyltransferase, partial [Agrobacterium vitis]|nr:N-acetyltransferase [Agrobacterium vitis]